MNIQDPEFTYFVTNSGTYPRLFNSNDHTFEQAMDYFKNTISTEKLIIHQYNESRTKSKVVERYDYLFKDVKAPFKVRVWRTPQKNIEKKIKTLLSERQFRSVSHVKDYLQENWKSISRRYKMSSIGMEISVIEEKDHV